MLRIFIGLLLLPSALAQAQTPSASDIREGKRIWQGYWVWRMIASFATASAAKADLRNRWRAINSTMLNFCALFAREQEKRCPHL